MNRPHPHRNLLFLPLLILAACASNPYKYAETRLDKAHVTLRSVEEVQKEILDVVSDPAVQPSVKTALKVVSHDATLAATEFGKAMVEVESALAALQAGTDTAERLRIANANLVTWTNTMNERVASIKKSLKEAKTP